MHLFQYCVRHKHIKSYRDLTYSMRRLHSSCCMHEHSADSSGRQIYLNIYTVCVLQSYISRMATCLLGSGQGLEGPSATQLGRLQHELCCLHTVKARVTPRDWSSRLSGVVVTGEREGGATNSSGVDWAALAVSRFVPLCFSWHDDAAACHCHLICTTL